MDVFIGIDPSLNSTGVCLLYYGNNEKIKEYFAITKPNSLNKKEQEAQEKYLNFDYHIYEKFDLSKIEDNHIKEIKKTSNYIKNAQKIYSIISENTNYEDNIYLVLEGISYGSSIRTKSVFDLAGLNYMIRFLLFRLSGVKYDNLIHGAFIPPTEIKKFATGKGNANKAKIIEEFKKIYPDFNLPKLDDICDAYFMAAYAKYMKDNDYEIFKD